MTKGILIGLPISLVLWAGIIAVVAHWPFEVAAFFMVCAFLFVAGYALGPVVRGSVIAPRER